MAKFRMQASAEDVVKADEDMGEFVVPPAGFYVVQLIEVNPGYSKGSDGEEDKSRPRLECVYEIVAEGREQAEPKANYGRLWDYVSFSKEAGWHRANFTKSLYPEAVQDDGTIDIELDTDDMVERKMLARIKHERDKRASDEAGKRVDRARIARFYSLDDDSAFDDTADTTDAYADSGSDAAAEADPFAEVGGDETDDGLLTEDELDKMDLKELGTVAKEFDLEPTSFIVKTRNKLDQEKTKAAVIAAILEAQGDDGNDDGGDEDPF